ncbi:hypothetical protein Tco_0007827 [Tanacetum coccineum]
MRSDELYKFCDSLLTSVRRVLHDIANNLRMDYLPKRRWSNLDKKRSRIMIKCGLYGDNKECSSTKFFKNFLVNSNSFSKKRNVRVEREKEDREGEYKGEVIGKEVVRRGGEEVGLVGDLGSYQREVEVIQACGQKQETERREVSRDRGDGRGLEGIEEEEVFRAMRIRGEEEGGEEEKGSRTEMRSEKERSRGEEKQKQHSKKELLVRKGKEIKGLRERGGRQEGATMRRSRVSLESSKVRVSRVESLVTNIEEREEEKGRRGGK